MNRRLFRLKRLFFITASIAIVSMSLVVGIAYYVLAKMTFAGDRIVHGRNIAETALCIRSELLKQKNISAVRFESGDGLVLDGLLIKRERPSARAVICHGYRSSKEFMYRALDLFPDWDIILFDFRAHGKSEGQITSLGFHEYKDVIAATAYLKKNTDNNLPLYVMGISMGGAAALHAAERQPTLCDALIIDSTYARLTSLVIKSFSSKVHLPLYPFFPVIKILFGQLAAFDMSSMNPEESVAKIKQPILFIHSINDTFISSSNCLKLYAKAQNNASQLWIAPKCRHGWLHTYFPDLYKKKVLDFIHKKAQD